MVQGLFFRKFIHRIQLKTYRGNTQQVAFTPIGFAKQSYWKKHHHYVFIIELQDHKTTFLKKTNPEKMLTNDYISCHTISKQRYLLLIFSFNLGCFTAVKNACRGFLQLFIGADIKNSRWKTWARCWKRCLAISEPFPGFSCSFQRVITFRLVSPCHFHYKNRFPHMYYTKRMDFFFQRKSCLTFFAFVRILKSYFALE